MTITTNRITLDELKAIETQGIIYPSMHKPNWAYILHFDHLNPSPLKESDGFFHDRDGSVLKIHFSLTNITNDQLCETGVAHTLHEWSTQRRSFNLRSHNYQIHQVRDGLYLMQDGDSRSFVLADNAMAIHRQLGAQHNAIQQNAMLWYKWVANDATVSEHSDGTLFKFPNGLSVRMESCYTRFCQTCWMDEYVDHEHADDFYMWLTRFF